MLLRGGGEHSFPRSAQDCMDTWKAILFGFFSHREPDDHGNISYRKTHQGGFHFMKGQDNLDKFDQSDDNLVHWKSNLCVYPSIRFPMCKIVIRLIECVDVSILSFPHPKRHEIILQPIKLHAAVFEDVVRIHLCANFLPALFGPLTNRLILGLLVQASQAAYDRDEARKQLADMKIQVRFAVC